jgi:hypothetical protein
MLYIVKDLNDPYLELIKDDPVRPEIPVALRVTETSEVFVLLGDQGHRAVTCVSYADHVPESVADLYTSNPQVAVFYTIWSYDPGAARELILAARAWQQQHRPEIVRWVTLSPKTEMARKFHLKNGAGVFRENTDTVNYEYC